MMMKSQHSIPTPSLSLLVLSVAIFFTVPTNSMWFFSQMRIASLGSVGTPAKCDLIPGISRRQRKVCQTYPDVMEVVGEGAKLGIKQCRTEFDKERWNCSTVEKAGTGKVTLKLGSRESAFVYAISSAGVVHSIARACAKGSLLGCSCAQGKRGTGYDSENNEFTWGGCGDNVKFAATFARRFLDSKERRRRDGKSLMNLHNNRAGRKIVKSSLKIQCKCHGVSGSCTTRTCWYAVPDFETVGHRLYQKYRRATQVTVSPKGSNLIAASSRGSSLRLDEPLHNHQQDGPVHSPSSVFNNRQQRKTAPAKRKNSKPRVKRSDLVFFEPSPDYCVSDNHTGSLGTAGRRCNKTSDGPDSCDLLCCGRGYDTYRTVQSFKCHCKFVWCCHVECSTCQQIVDIHTCKGYGSTQKQQHSLHSLGPGSEHSLHGGSRFLSSGTRYRYVTQQRNSQQHTSPPPQQPPQQQQQPQQQHSFTPPHHTQARQLRPSRLRTK